MLHHKHFGSKGGERSFAAPGTDNRSADNVNFRCFRTDGCFRYYRVIAIDLTDCRFQPPN